MLYTRDRLEHYERQRLAPYAALAAQSRGRIYPEQEAEYRTAFQKDRDRVIHTSAFRRLEYKTQVFINYQGDHYRTRLTHTLEVAQVAKSIARALGLNEDLAETIALAHDLGHPPFGHAGEDVLNVLAQEAGGFDHNKQSLRVVTELEQRYPDFPGLNLTWETLEGIMKHETAYDLPSSHWEPDKQPSLEAQVVDIADELAYNAHDLDDGLRSGHLQGWQLPEVPLLASLMDSLGIAAERIEAQQRYLLIRELLGLTIRATIEHSHATIEAMGFASLEHVRSANRKVIGAEDSLQQQMRQLKTFLYDNFYFHYRQIRMTNKAGMILERMFAAYQQAPDMLPKDVRAAAESRGLVRAITDYLAGMTDRYATEEYRRLFDPEVLT